MAAELANPINAPKVIPDKHKEELEDLVKSETLEYIHYE